MKVRVLLADDNRLIRAAMRAILGKATDIELVAEVEDGRTVVEAASRTHPDVVCMDINMPGLGGIAATRQLLAVRPDAKVVAFSAHSSLIMVAQMIGAGAVGYVVKSNAGTELLPAIRLASRNETYLSPELHIKDVTELLRYAQDAGAQDIAHDKK